MKTSYAAACAMAMALVHVHAQTPCKGSRIGGTIRDSTLALIPGATVTLDDHTIKTSGSDGSFAFPCVGSGKHRISAVAEGFAANSVSWTVPLSGALEIRLAPESVQAQVEVTATADAAISTNASGLTQTISGSRLQSLADDPDDLQRELQQLAAAAGANPSNTTFAVDGFQGNSKLPPKSSIAYIQVNPDLYSAEYREPPFEGGRVEVYTKPGQKAYHGALFTTNGSPWENARDPFSTSRAAIGKQRYGFELTGPVRKLGSDFALTLEHRSIDNFAVVNAITLDSNGNTVSTVGNVATPQQLWLGTAKLDWQLGPKNTFISSYSANVNHLQNVGTGGNALGEAGYDSQQYEHMFRVSDITSVSAHLMHEARASFRWDGETDNPVSTAPQVQVAGAFTGGGATVGPQHLREFNIEADDDAIITTQHHTLKLGTQFMMYDEHQQLTTNFNGTYIFGGGTAPVLDANSNPLPGQTMTITGVEQYRRAVLRLPGGTPTAFSNVAGTPGVAFTQVMDSSFIQDDWNIGHGLHLAAGLRYFVQTDPTLLGTITPRAGILWSPGKKNTWTLHAHAGLFGGYYGQNTQAEMLREDGVKRITSTVYNPNFGDPFAGAVPLHTIRQYSPHISNLTWAAENIGGTHTLPGGWNLSFDYYIGRIWNYTRSANINPPVDGNPLGPRPGAQNVNVLQLQNSGQGNVDLGFFSLEQHTLKLVQLTLGVVRVNLKDDTDDDEFSTPQNTYSDAGEFAYRTGRPLWNIFGNATLTLPAKLQLSGDFNAHGDRHYNITTGFDNNGDGDFNDRPQYAAPGAPGAVSTPWGLLIASGGTGVFPRNQGIMPWTYYFDTNLQRAFTLTRNPKAEHQNVLTLNLRSSNVLNHLNITQVGGVLGSPQFGVPYAADNGRRIEAGARYSF